MPALAFLFAGGLAVVVTTGALLDKLNVRRSWRVFVWSGFFLFALLIAFVLFMLALDGPFKWPC
jgi:hypothetical protein